MTCFIGITGAVASGKSTMAACLSAALVQQNPSMRVQTVCTDAFLYPLQTLETLGLLKKKGFPESYDMQALVRCLSQVKQGDSLVLMPNYSHLSYDIVPGSFVSITQPDFLIVDGLNVLSPHLRDFFDFSIYLDAEEDILECWYTERFLRLCAEGAENPNAYFYRYAGWGLAELKARASSIWYEINLPNLRQNILPTREAAHLVLKKSADHTFL